MRFSFKRILFVLTFSTVALAPKTYAQETHIQDATLEGYEFCTVCHGSQLMGNQNILAPRLSGLPAWYVERQLKNFKLGIRGKHTEYGPGLEMQNISVELNENEIPDIAKWVSQTSSPPAPSTIIGDSELGQNLYQVCSACHGVNGEGNEALNAPPLAGIDDWYLVAQIKNFRDGLRGANPKDQYGAQMKAFVASIKSDDDINNLVSYINQLTKPKR